MFLGKTNSDTRWRSRPSAGCKYHSFVVPLEPELMDSAMDMTQAGKSKPVYLFPADLHLPLDEFFFHFLVRVQPAPSCFKMTANF